jgi:hypothetical protein
MSKDAEQEIVGKRSAQGVDELPAFQDHAAEDRGLGRGHFSSDHRDRVELGPVVPALRAEAPRLDDAELARQLAVVSEVLGCMLPALEQAGQDGHSVIQLVLESAPRHLRPLFEGVGLDPSGRVDERRLTHNLRSRPPMEQRRFLHQGLTDLLSRALSQCMDILEDAAADPLLREVMGFQKRLKG